MLPGSALPQEEPKLTEAKGEWGAHPAPPEGQDKPGARAPRLRPHPPRSGAHSSACQGTVPSPTVGRHRGRRLGDPQPSRCQCLRLSEASAVLKKQMPQPRPLA